MLVELWMLIGALVEFSLADEQQLAITQRQHGRRARQPIKHRKLANDGACPKNRDDTFSPRPRCYTDLEEPLLDPIATITCVFGDEEHLIGREVNGLCVREEERAQALRKLREKSYGRVCYRHGQIRHWRDQHPQS